MHKLQAQLNYAIYTGNVHSVIPGH